MLEARKPKGHEQNDKEARAALIEHPDIYAKVLQHEPLTPEDYRAQFTAWMASVAEMKPLERDWN